MKKQLKLTESELFEIGFVEYKSEGDDMNVPRNYYKIDSINSCFYYNPDQPIHVWYYKTEIGDASNHVHLDIQVKPTLYSLLSSFRVEFNLVF